MTSFSSFDLPAPVLKHLTATGLIEAFPIQAATLPDTLQGRDVLGRGRTGSGKTLAFSLPMVTRLAAAGGRRTPSRPRALVLAPTRELANQINATIEPLATSLGLTTTTVFGGVAQSRQVTALRAGVDILIACPGRLEDLLNQKLLTLDEVAITVLDEADHMADLGFLPGVKRIMDRTPTRGQRMLFSATLDNGVDILVKRYLSNPLRHSVDSAESPVAAMTHHVFALASADDKKRVVHELASGTSKRLLFTRTKHQAKKLAKQLTAGGVPAVDLHGNLSQPARERNLAAFSTGAVRVLVATDIAARGIHVDDVELVVHVDPPAEHKAYLHRSGRTARAGSGGDVVTLMLPEEAGDVRTLTRLAKITAKPQHIRPGDQALQRLVGEVAAVVMPPAPQPEVVGARTGGTPASARSRGNGGRGQGGRSGGAQAGRSGQGGRSAQGGAQGGRSGGGSAGRSSGGQGGRSGQGRGPAQGGSTVMWSSSSGGSSSGSYGSGSGSSGSSGGGEGGRRQRPRGRRPAGV